MSDNDYKTSEYEKNNYKDDEKKCTTIINKIYNITNSFNEEKSSFDKILLMTKIKEQSKQYNEIKDSMYNLMKKFVPTPADNFKINRHKKILKKTNEDLKNNIEGFTLKN